MASFVFLKFLMTLSLGQASYLTPHQYFDSTRHLFLSFANTNWDFFEGDDRTSQTISKDKSLQFVARSPYIIEGGLQPTLTLRIDKGPWSSARAYGERWLKDIPKYGYELQMSRDATYGNLKGFEIELFSTQSKRVSRQFIVKESQELWVFNCTSDQKHFSTSWKACEKILKTAKH